MDVLDKNGETTQRLRSYAHARLTARTQRPTVSELKTQAPDLTLVVSITIVTIVTRVTLISV